MNDSVFVYSIGACVFSGRQPHFESVCKDGAKLKSGGQLSSKTISHRIATLQDHWKKLSETAASRNSRLKEAAQAQQVDKTLVSRWADVHVCCIPHLLVLF